jgi:hypothetical protein
MGGRVFPRHPHRGPPLNSIVMQHKDAAADRWVLLIIVVVVALNLYWAISAIGTPDRVNPGFVIGGLFAQVVGIAGALRMFPPGVHRYVPAILFLFAVLFGASTEWFGLFHGYERGRISPSVWAPAK